MIRVLSDLHLFDARTQVRNLAQLEPLFVGVDELVLNGDTCETRAGATPAQVAELRRFFTTRVRRVVFLTGNHDPDISETHEVLAADDRVWITHGDIFLPGLTPWSRHAAQFRERRDALLAADPAADWARLDVRYRIARQVALEENYLPDRTTRTLRAHLVWVWETFFPPAQVMAMLRCWRDLPRLTVEFAATVRPRAQVVITGHVHFPRIWRHRDRPTVINTGSFFRPLGGNLVDVYDDRVEVHSIVRRHGVFRPGPFLARIPLA